MAHPRRPRVVARSQRAWYPGAMTVNAASQAIPAAVRRILEVVYTVEGVVAARVWQEPGKIAVGVRGGGGTTPTDLLRRVEAAVVGLREPGVSWEFGSLQEP